MTEFPRPAAEHDVTAPPRRPSFLSLKLHALVGRNRSDDGTSSIRRLVSWRRLRRRKSVGPGAARAGAPALEAEGARRAPSEFESHQATGVERAGGSVGCKNPRIDGATARSPVAQARPASADIARRAESGSAATSSTPLSPPRPHRSSTSSSWLARRLRLTRPASGSGTVSTDSGSSCGCDSRFSSLHSDTALRVLGSAISLAPGSVSPKAPRTLRDVYRLGPVLGVGTFSVVKLATEVETGANWACKIVQLTDEKGSDQETTREEILAEVELLRSLAHPNIMHVREYFEDGDSMFVITEMLHGGELLKAVMERGSYPEDDARQVFRQLLDAVQYMHRQGVVHRDIKLENLILAHKNDITSVKIADFGLAVRAEGRTLTAVCGTPQYVAPEVLRSARDGPYDHRCDIWSCGIVLFNMLAGYPPFHSESVPKLLRQVALAEVDYCDPVWELISPEATDLLQKVLTATAEERISVAEALVHPWMMHR